MVKPLYRVRTVLVSVCLALSAPLASLLPAASPAAASLVAVMRTDADRSRGLMFRRTMAPNHGMLFDFERTEPVAMWMKNTYLPLDMLFIRADGTIALVAADTEPLSTAIIQSPEPVLSVLELNAGTAAKLGLKVGDRVEHPLFKAR